MSSNQVFVSFLFGWPALVFSALTGRIASFGSALSVSEYATWFFVAAAPVAALLILQRGQATAPISQVLYDTERAGDAGQERPARR